MRGSGTPTRAPTIERAESLFPEDGTIYRDLGVVYYQYAVWAEQAKQSARAHAYYVQARDAWLKALGAPPVTQAAANYQTVYPDLASVLWNQFHDLCEAGQYAQFALNAVKAGTLERDGANGADVAGDSD